MKNLLSENMLRFGTKNLSEAAQRELVLKSIMETINEHGLHGAVRRSLTEQTGTDPAWLTTAKDELAGKNANGNFLSLGIIKKGASYTQPYDNWANEEYPTAGKPIAVWKKGSSWYSSPSLTVCWCTCFVYEDSEPIVGPSGAQNWEKLNDPNVLSQLANGTYKVNGKAVTGIKSNIVWYPSVQDVVVTQGGKVMQMAIDQGAAMRTALLANSPDVGQANDAGKYIPGQ